MAEKVENNSGSRMSLYFDKDLWNKLEIGAARLQLTTTEFVRHSVKNYLDNEAVREVEKAQAFNTAALKILLNKLSHIEMLSAVTKKEFESKGVGVLYEDELKKIKKRNREIVDNIVEENL